MRRIGLLTATLFILASACTTPFVSPNGRWITQDVSPLNLGDEWCLGIPTNEYDLIVSNDGHTTMNMPTEIDRCWLQIELEQPGYMIDSVLSAGEVTHGINEVEWHFTSRNSMEINGVHFSFDLLKENDVIMIGDTLFHYYTDPRPALAD